MRVLFGIIGLHGLRESEDEASFATIGKHGDQFFVVFDGPTEANDVLTPDARVLSERNAT